MNNLVTYNPHNIMSASVINILSLFILSSVLINVYFIIANKFSIIDKPNHRSSHTKITIRGGGVIIPVMVTVYEMINGVSHPLFLAGLLLISLLSFWDDIRSIPSRYRILAQLMAVILMILELQPSSMLLGVVSLIAVTGFINGYNFMDGINGITGVYSLILVLTLQIVNSYIYPFIDLYIFYYLLIPVVVFLFYNFRRKAKCFAGDVGSVSLAFIISFLMLQLIIKSGNLFYLFFVTVYGIDIIFTIIQRLLLKQNIFEAHRIHLYQVLANEVGWSHRSVSLLYGLIQLIINSLVISVSLSELTINQKWIFFGLLLVLITVFYLIVKRRLMVKYSLSQ